MHQTPETVIIVDGIVLRATIVPERERPGLPAEAAGEFRTCQVVEEIVEDWCTFRCSHVLEADGVTAVHVERLAPGFRMGPDDGCSATYSDFASARASPRNRSSRVRVALALAELLTAMSPC